MPRKDPPVALADRFMEKATDLHGDSVENLAAMLGLELRKKNRPRITADRYKGDSAKSGVSPAKNTETPREMREVSASGRGGTRTPVGVSQQIYSLPRLTTPARAPVPSVRTPFAFPGGREKVRAALFRSNPSARPCIGPSRAGGYRALAPSIRAASTMAPSASAPSIFHRAT